MQNSFEEFFSVRLLSTKMNSVSTSARHLLQPLLPASSATFQFFEVSGKELQHNLLIASTSTTFHNIIQEMRLTKSPGFVDIAQLSAQKHIHCHAFLS